MNLFRKIKNREAFTLIEILVSIAIFIMISSITMINYRQGEKNNIFKLQAFDLEDLIRSTQNMALTGRKIEDLFPEAYGIFFDATRKNIIIYADKDGDYFFNEANDLIFSSNSLQDGIHFLKFNIRCKSNKEAKILDIDFIPPKPSMLINGNSNCNLATISLSSDFSEGIWKIYFDSISGRVWTEFSN